jgi:hypothetical protein
MAKEATLNHFLLTDRDMGRAAILPASDTSRERQSALPRLDWRQAAGAVLILAGLVGVLASWVGVSGTRDTASQLSYLTSGGLGGIGLIAVGVLLLVSFEHSRDRLALKTLELRLAEVESTVVVELAAAQPRDPRVG